MPGFFGPFFLVLVFNRVAGLGRLSAGKNGHETFRQARIYNFRDKYVVFARNLKCFNLTQ